MAYNVSHNLNFFTRIFTQFFALQIHDSFCFLKQIVCTLQSNNLPFFVVYYLLQQPTVELEDHLKSQIQLILCNCLAMESKRQSHMQACTSRQSRLQCGKLLFKQSR
ncbi:uncharacterized protein LOC126706517 isoform X2 [Quercus robur]|uniref:uncharacterized protein LOC126706517 isoform X2 n=1 Tax=Quercus robur TaxID=38942 RepID=UPI00216362A8|nr:uncharacterized protein LOC126706517 isoform X2 [Quercus robur]